MWLQKSQRWSLRAAVVRISCALAYLCPVFLCTCHVMLLGFFPMLSAFGDIINSEMNIIDSKRFLHDADKLHSSHIHAQAAMCDFR